MITHIDGREQEADHHYQLIVNKKDGEDVRVYPYPVSTIWEFAPPGELPEDIGDHMSVAKGGPSEQPGGPIDLVIGRDYAELLPCCLACCLASEAAQEGDRLWLYESPVSKALIVASPVDYRNFHCRTDDDSGFRLFGMGTGGSGAGSNRRSSNERRGSWRSAVSSSGHAPGSNFGPGQGAKGSSGHASGSSQRRGAGNDFEHGRSTISAGRGRNRWWNRLNMLAILCMIGIMSGNGAHVMKAYDCRKGRTWVQSMAELDFCPYVRRPSEIERQRHSEVVPVEKDVQL